MSQLMSPKMRAMPMLQVPLLERACLLVGC
jgi:hypothetical protein